MKSEEANNIKSTQTSLNILFKYSGNVDLFIEVQKKLISNISFEEKNIKAELDLIEVVDTIALAMLNEMVFYPCHAIYLFQHEPSKLLKWLTAFLKSLEERLQEVVLKLILIVINDKVRFNQESGNLNYIKSQLETKASILLTKDISSIPVKWEDYFQIKCSVMDYTTALLSVRGLQSLVEGEFKVAIDRPKVSPNKLIDVWLSDHGHYQAVIEFLKKPNQETGLPFINEDGKWIEQIVLLGAFVRKCKKEKYIGSEIKQAVLERIINATFNLNLKDTPSLRKRAIFSPDQDDAFRHLPAPKKP